MLEKNIAMSLLLAFRGIYVKAYQNAATTNN